MRRRGPDEELLVPVLGRPDRLGWADDLHRQPRAPSVAGIAPSRRARGTRADGIRVTSYLIASSSGSNSPRSAFVARSLFASSAVASALSSRRPPLFQRRHDARTAA